MKLNLIIKIFILFNGINGVFFSSDFQIEDRTLIQEKDQIKKDESSNIIYYTLGSALLAIVIIVIYKLKSTKSNAAPQAPLKHEEKDDSLNHVIQNVNRFLAVQASLKRQENNQSGEQDISSELPLDITSPDRNVMSNLSPMVKAFEQSDNPTQQQTTENDKEPSESPAPSYGTENNKDDKDDKDDKDNKDNKDNKEPIQS